MRLHFVFKSAVHFQLLFVKAVGVRFACGCLAVPAAFVEEAASAPPSDSRKVKRRCAETWRRQRVPEQNTKPLSTKGTSVQGPVFSLRTWVHPKAPWSGQAPSPQPHAASRLGSARPEAGSL